MARVALYGATWCGSSIRAERLLRERGVAYVFIDVDEVPGARLAMVERSGEVSIPQLLVDGRAVGGYDALLDLDAKGVLVRVLGGGATDHRHV